MFVEETGVEVNNPEAAAAVQLEKNSILIAITKDNKVIYGGRDIGIATCNMKRLVLKEDIPVIIQIIGVFARVYGEAAGAKSINAMNCFISPKMSKYNTPKYRIRHRLCHRHYYQRTPLFGDPVDSNL